MIKIEKAKKADTEVLALLGRQTYAESHGHFINDKNDLLKYLDENFSVSRLKEDLANPKYIFYLIYVDGLPVGYAKLIIGAEHQSIASQNNCCLEKIYILNDFIPLKIGQQLLTYVEEQAKVLTLDTMWLSVYTENSRAIRFYEKNEFVKVGELNFVVNGKSYENIVLSKTL